MKLKFSKSSKINKGAPSGFVISLIFHAVAFFIAGLFVVFTVLPKAEPEFKAPPPVERPKMKLKKPKVKVKKSSQPKPSSRIVAKVKSPNMPEIQLPDLMGTGEGLLGGMGVGGEFMDLPDIGEVSVFGSAMTTGNDLVGTFYDFKRKRDGSLNSVAYEEVDDIIYKFMQKGWKPSALATYYQSPKKLYASCVCIGTVQSTLAPEAFGEYTTEGWAWAVLYRGKLVYPEDIKFRFRGVGDKFLAVRVDGKVVFLTFYRKEIDERFGTIWDSHAPDDLVYPMGEYRQTVGDWIELKGGVPVDIEIILGDREGGLVYQQLVVEVDGVEYPRSSWGGGPRCPVFKTDNLTREQIDTMYLDVYPEDVNLTNGPVFCDYIAKPVSYAPVIITNSPPVFAKEGSKAMRTWTSASGDSIDGKFLLNTPDYILVEDAKKQQQKLPLDQLSKEDLRFVDLAKPPEFRIEFAYHSDQFQPKTLGPYDNDRPLAIFDYLFGVKIKQYSSGTYNHELKMEYFAIGSEVKGDNYVLLDRKSSSYTPTKANKRSYEYHGNPIRLRKYANRVGYPYRGIKYDGYLIVVRDEEDRIVQYETSNEFLFRNLDRLSILPINAHFDKHVIRTWPSRPGPEDRSDNALPGAK